uniref:ATP synthase F0 subunit 6 n=1 Tax=Busonia albilateralis TaxID=2479888 RepID=UPI002410FD6A|nr:ATP synthase F0 subunit 6 [Busonia albilateralis]WEP24814.1 ATP synthase F0 subunit 6 [Busonia albilateralis]
MTNLFSSFDPCTGTFSLNWLSSFIFIFIKPYKFWMKNNISYLVFIKILKNLHAEFKLIMSYNGSNLMILSMFFMILIINSIGLVPYIFTSSSHLIFSLSLSLPLWMGLMIYGWFMKTNFMLAHLLPTGSPVLLMPFLVLIELTSNLIRPGSLAVRLSANMIAGHLLMSLMGSNSNFSLMFILMLLFMMFMLFELAVAFIQSYVFVTLMTLYSSEI